MGRRKEFYDVNNRFLYLLYFFFFSRPIITTGRAEMTFSLATTIILLYTYDCFSYIQQFFFSPLFCTLSIPRTNRTGALRNQNIYTFTVTYFILPSLFFNN